MEKNQKHYGTWGIFERPSNKHIQTCYQYDYALEGANYLTKHEKNNGRNNFYEVAKVYFKDDLEGNGDTND